MKKILFLLSGLIVSFGVCFAAFYFFSDYQAMQSEMPGRRPDVRGVVQSVQNYQITVIPFDKDALPFKDFSREEMKEKMASLSQEERRSFREKMQKKFLQEIDIELPMDISIYKKIKRLSRKAKRLSISDIEATNIVSIWMEPIEEGKLPKAEFITIFSSEFYNE